MPNFGIRCRCLNLKVIHPRCVIIDYVSRDSAVTQYNQSGDKFRFIPSHRQALPFRELSIRTLTSTRHNNFHKSHHKIQKMP